MDFSPSLDTTTGTMSGVKSCYTDLISDVPFSFPSGSGTLKIIKLRGLACRSITSDTTVSSEEKLEGLVLNKRFSNWLTLFSSTAVRPPKSRSNRNPMSRKVIF